MNDTKCTLKMIKKQKNIQLFMKPEGKSLKEKAKLTLSYVKL